MSMENGGPDPANRPWMRWAIIGATVAGIPVSTTHTITGAIVGVGATKRLSAVRWGVAGNIIWAWILTIPVSAIISAVIYFSVNYFVG